MDAAIPPFYCVYLLRSKAQPARFYVGSTPDPTRRLRQHNGSLQGGARRTVGSKLKPWTMATLVTGFPSSIAALQFEWAWQNPHITRHIQERITPCRYTKTMAKTKKGKWYERTKVHKGHEPILDKFRNLHLLLRSPSFRRLPLNLRFLSADSYNQWKTTCTRATEPVTDRIATFLDYDSAQKGFSEEKETTIPTPLPPATAALDLTYEYLKPRLEKSFRLLNDNKKRRCACCQHSICQEGSPVVICSSNDCEMMSHMSCLAAQFLENHADSDAILPTAGSCPTCGSSLQWSDLMRELSLRMSSTAAAKLSDEKDSPTDSIGEKLQISEALLTVSSPNEPELQQPLTAAGSSILDFRSIADIEASAVKQDHELPDNWDETESEANLGSDNEDDLPTIAIHDEIDNLVTAEGKPKFPKVILDSEQEEADLLHD